MTRIPRDPTPSEGLSATWTRQLLKYLRESRLVAGAGIRLSCGPHGTVIDSTATATAVAAEAQYYPFVARFHTTKDDSNGQWEVRIPNGAVSVGGACYPLNKAASEKSGHNGESGWYLLYLDESEGTAETRQETDAEGHNVTVSYRRWAVTAHCKTSAKVTGVDALNASERRLVYFSADKMAAPGETFQEEPMARKFAWGDEFSAVVGTIIVEERGGTKSRRFSTNGAMAIAVAGRARQNFDLVWYFSVDQYGKLVCDNVYAIRNSMTVAGMNVVGETMTNVSALKAPGSHTLFICVDINEDNGQNAISVYVDPSDTNPDSDFTAWAQLYGKGETSLIDYRASALNNVQVYR